MPICRHCPALFLLAFLILGAEFPATRHRLAAHAEHLANRSIARLRLQLLDALGDALAFLRDRAEARSRGGAASPSSSSRRSGPYSQRLLVWERSARSPTPRLASHDDGHRQYRREVARPATKTEIRTADVAAGPCRSWVPHRDQALLVFRSDGELLDRALFGAGRVRGVD
jgi:hypothetical protein